MLYPAHAAFADTITQPALRCGQAALPTLHFHEDDLVHVALTEPIEDEIVNGRAQEARIGRMPGEAFKHGSPLLSGLTRQRPMAPLMSLREPLFATKKPAHDEGKPANKDSR